MTIHIKEVLPVLATILEQQRAISDRLRKLVQTFKREPEPVEPTLRLMLKPLTETMNEMDAVLSPTSSPADYLESPNE